MITKEEQMLALVNHLYWFYNADMADVDNERDFKDTIAKLEVLIKQ